MQHVFDSPIGRIELWTEGDALTRIVLCSDGTVTAPANRLLEDGERQIIEYLEGKRQAFDLPFALLGTPFQLSVWNEARQIPYGETVTYGELARRIGRPGAAQAVGNALGANNLPLIVPCHRIVSSGGMGGFAYGADMKRKLLSVETEYHRLSIEKQAGLWYHEL